MKPFQRSFFAFYQMVPFKTSDGKKLWLDPHSMQSGSFLDRLPEALPNSDPAITEADLPSKHVWLSSDSSKFADGALPYLSVNAPHFRHAQGIWAKKTTARFVSVNPRASHDQPKDPTKTFFRLLEPVLDQSLKTFEKNYEEAPTLENLEAFIDVFRLFYEDPASLNEQLSGFSRSLFNPLLKEEINFELFFEQNARFDQIRKRWLLLVDHAHAYPSLEKSIHRAFVLLRLGKKSEAIAAILEAKKFYETADEVSVELKTALIALFHQGFYLQQTGFETKELFLKEAARLIRSLPKLPDTSRLGQQNAFLEMTQRVLELSLDYQLWNDTLKIPQAGYDFDLWQQGQKEAFNRFKNSAESVEIFQSKLLKSMRESNPGNQELALAFAAPFLDTILTRTRIKLYQAVEDFKSKRVSEDKIKELLSNIERDWDENLLPLREILKPELLDLYQSEFLDGFAEALERTGQLQKANDYLTTLRNDKKFQNTPAGRRAAFELLGRASPLEAAAIELFNSAYSERALLTSSTFLGMGAKLLVKPSAKIPFWGTAQRTPFGLLAFLGASCFVVLKHREAILDAFKTRLSSISGEEAFQHLLYFGLNLGSMALGIRFVGVPLVRFIGAQILIPANLRTLGWFLESGMLSRKAGIEALRLSQALIGGIAPLASILPTFEVAQQVFYAATKMPRPARTFERNVLEPILLTLTLLLNPLSAKTGEASLRLSKDKLNLVFNAVLGYVATESLNPLREEKNLRQHLDGITDFGVFLGCIRGIFRFAYGDEFALDAKNRRLLKEWLKQAKKFSDSGESSAPASLSLSLQVAGIEAELNKIEQTETQPNSSKNSRSTPLKPHAPLLSEGSSDSSSPPKSPKPLDTLVSELSQIRFGKGNSLEELLPKIQKAIFRLDRVIQKIDEILKHPDIETKGAQFKQELLRERHLSESSKNFMTFSSLLALIPRAELAENGADLVLIEQAIRLFEKSREAFLELNYFDSDPVLLSHLLFDWIESIEKSSRVKSAQKQKLILQVYADLARFAWGRAGKRAQSEPDQNATLDQSVFELVYQDTHARFLKWVAKNSLRVSKMQIEFYQEMLKGELAKDFVEKQIKAKTSHSRASALLQIESMQELFYLSEAAQNIQKPALAEKVYQAIKQILDVMFDPKNESSRSLKIDVGEQLSVIKKLSELGRLTLKAQHPVIAEACYLRVLDLIHQLKEQMKGTSELDLVEISKQFLSIFEAQAIDGLKEAASAKDAAVKNPN